MNISQNIKKLYQTTSKRYDEKLLAKFNSAFLFLNFTR